MTKVLLPNNNLRGACGAIVPPGRIPPCLDTPLRHAGPGPLSESVGLAYRLSQLVLNNNQISGPLPVSLFRLPSLSVLLLHDNKISGGIPSEIFLLSSLTVLRLDGNKLTGCIPAELCRLKELKRMSVARNQLRGSLPENLHALTGLQEFIANDNQLSGPVPVRYDVTSYPPTNPSRSSKLPLRSPGLCILGPGADDPRAAQQRSVRGAVCAGREHVAHFAQH